MLIIGTALLTALSCVEPGRCVPPGTQYSRVLPLRPHQQWNIAGGFCGALSVQAGALAHGAWISEDLVRKANNFGTGHCDGGEPGRPGPYKKLGCEIGALNIGETANNLKLDFDEWNWNATRPQSTAYKQWMKKHLVQGHAIVWFVMCKGDDPCPYDGACPNGGAFGHIEPVWGIYSNHTLNDTTVYDDDWVVHGSDQDLNPYYRKFSSLQDSTRMDGNCAKAQPGYGRNEMYPCINDQTDYGIAIAGLNGGGKAVSLAVDTQEEPDPRQGQVPSKLSGTVTVSGLAAGATYILYRYDGTASVPTDGSHAGYSAKKEFTAAAETWSYTDPAVIWSDAAVYYYAF